MILLDVSVFPELLRLDDSQISFLWHLLRREDWRSIYSSIASRACTIPLLDNESEFVKLFRFFQNNICLRSPDRRDDILLSDTAFYIVGFSIYRFEQVAAPNIDDRTNRIRAACGLIEKYTMGYDYNSFNIDDYPLFSKVENFLLCVMLGASLVPNSRVIPAREWSAKPSKRETAIIFRLIECLLLIPRFCLPLNDPIIGNLGIV
jgi:hypothetical protein